MARKTGPDKETVALVKARSGGVCECCGVNEGQQIHHRRPRGIGGTRDTSINLPSNLVDICAACHSSIESRRSAASEAGWLVSRLSGVRCCEVPVLCWYGRVVLDDSGGFEVVE